MAFDGGGDEENDKSCKWPVMRHRRAFKRMMGIWPTVLSTARAHLASALRTSADYLTGVMISSCLMRVLF